jgi:predicted lipid carrier protein YhbT
MTLRFAYGERGFRPVFDAAPADLTISARARDFLALLAREEDPDTLFFNRRLLMEGDTDLGLLVKNTLDGIDLPRFDPARLAPAELLHRLRARLATPHSA